MKDARQIAEYVVKKVQPHYPVEHSLEVPVLMEAFAEVGDRARVKKAVQTFMSLPRDPKNPYVRLYLLLGYRDDETDPRGYTFKPE